MMYLRVVAFNGIRAGSTEGFIRLLTLAGRKNEYVVPKTPDDVFIPESDIRLCQTRFDGGPFTMSKFTDAHPQPILSTWPTFRGLMTLTAFLDLMGRGYNSKTDKMTLDQFTAIYRDSLFVAPVVLLGPLSPFEHRSKWKKLAQLGAYSRRTPAQIYLDEKQQKVEEEKDRKTNNNNNDSEHDDDDDDKEDDEHDKGDTSEKGRRRRQRKRYASVSPATLADKGAALKLLEARYKNAENTRRCSLRASGKPFSKRTFEEYVEGRKEYARSTGVQNPLLNTVYPEFALEMAAAKEDNGSPAAMDLEEEDQEENDADVVLYDDDEMEHSAEKKKSRVERQDEEKQLDDSDLEVVTVHEDDEVEEPQQQQGEEGGEVVADEDDQQKAEAYYNEGVLPMGEEEGEEQQQEEEQHEEQQQQEEEQQEDEIFEEEAEEDLVIAAIQAKFEQEKLARLTRYERDWEEIQKPLIATYERDLAELEKMCQKAFDDAAAQKAVIAALEEEEAERQRQLQERIKQMQAKIVESAFTIAPLPVVAAYKSPPQRGNQTARKAVNQSRESIPCKPMPGLARIERTPSPPHGINSDHF